MKGPLFLALAASQLLTGSALALTPAKDNFKSSRLKKSIWTSKNYAKGKLTPAKRRVQFTVVGKPSGDDFAILELKNSRPGYNESWEVLLDVTNKSKQGFKVGTGILISNATDRQDNVSLEFYGNGRKGGVNLIGITDDRDNPQDDLLANPNVKKGSLKVSYDGNARLFTFAYDVDGSANGYQWTQLGTFSPTGAGGDRRGDWKMNPGSGSFVIQLFGYSDGRTVAAGKVTFDNFKLRSLR